MNAPSPPEAPPPLSEALWRSGEDVLGNRAAELEAELRELQEELERVTKERDDYRIAYLEAGGV